MKPLKLVLLLLGAGILLTAGIVALALLPSVQTWAARRALEGSPVAVEHVAAGPGAARLEGITLRQPGLVVRVGSLETRHSLGAWLGSRRLDVEEITLRDVVVERTPAPAEAGRRTRGVASDPERLGCRLELLGTHVQQVSEVAFSVGDGRRGHDPACKDRGGEP